MFPKRFFIASRTRVSYAWRQSPRTAAGIGVAAFFVLCGILFYLLFFLPPYNFPSEKIFEVRDGASLSEVSHSLGDGKIIRVPFLFTLFAKATGRERDIKAGLYYFEKPLSLLTVMLRLTDGNYEATPFQSTIKEGATIFGMGLFFEERGLFPAKDFWQMAGFRPEHYGNGGPGYVIDEALWADFPEVLAVKPPGEGFEGFLFPDTYFFPPHATPEAVMRAMLENFERKITDDMYKDASLQGKNFYDVLIMASIIEREAFNGDDGKIISGILWKRLREKYPLQTDAVLAYVTGKGSFALSVNDLQIDSPYNVYQRIGLPPTPISNPGLEAIEVALYPEETDYWYYLHNADGRAYYAKTFEEHKENKARYLR